MKNIVTKEIIFYVYRKWKNIVYYSNDLLYKKKIVDFENDMNIDQVFSDIALFFNTIDSIESKQYLKKLIKGINYYYKPKKVCFEKPQCIVGNESKKGYLESLNIFFRLILHLLKIQLD